MMRGLLLIAIAAIFGVWWWRKHYVPSALEVHFADLEAKQRNGNLAQLAAFAAPPPIATMATGWGSTTLLNPTNPLSPTHNKPGVLRLNMRFAQPTR